MSADVLLFAEVNNSGADALAERGVKFPFMGFAPGLYSQSCTTCGKRHLAAKRSTTCLPCAIALTALVAAQREDSRARDYAAGRQSGLDDVRRFLAGGARSGNLVRTPTPAQRDDVKRQACEVEAERAGVQTFAVVRTDAPGLWADNAPKVMIDGVEHYVLGAVEQRADDPEGAAEVDDLIERTQAARERIEAESRAAESAEPDPDGGDAA